MVSIVKTLPSLQLEQIVINARFTYSEMKEFVSRLFLINLEKIRSNYVSNNFFTFALSSLRTTNAFLLRVDLRLYANFMRSGIAALSVGMVSRSE